MKWQLAYTAAHWTLLLSIAFCNASLVTRWFVNATVIAYASLSALVVIANIVAELWLKVIIHQERDWLFVTLDFTLDVGIATIMYWKGLHWQACVFYVCAIVGLLMDVRLRRLSN